MKRKEKSGGGGANWMDTYGDMVTLLLCFFVMLYSMSTIDQNKWIAIVQSLNPDAVLEEDHQVGGDSSGIPDADSDIQPNVEDVFEDIAELYMELQQAVDQAGMADQVLLGEGSGYVFLSFDDAVFFDGDSYVLREEGKTILDAVATSIGNVSDSISEIRVLGHTAQGSPDHPNDVEFDRFLSSNRATVVTVYLQQKNIIDPARLVSVGYGQWRPISSNETGETRGYNRRVELIITGLDVENGLEDEIQSYYTMRDQAVDDANQTIGTDATESTSPQTEESTAPSQGGQP